ncbi:MAG: hypothetical protein ACRD2A_01950 [Vicinamibacterales bacterium]
MSRDRDVHTLLDRAAQRAPSGREMPRGGRSGGASRVRTRVPEDVRDALTRQLDLPRGAQRERVEVGSRSYSLRGSEVRSLATVGAFRVVDARDLTPAQSGDRWHGDLEHLREERLIALTPQILDGERTALVTLTRSGQALLERHRHPRADEPAQAFYSGLVKPREATHDAQLARVYAAAAERLHAGGARVGRVVVDYELKREYQRFLQANNRGRHDNSGRSDRSPEEVRAWAAANGLTIIGDRVQFPDVRVEYEHQDGRRDHEDLELATGHYNSRQMSAKRASGFRMHHSVAGRLGGAKGRRGGSPFDPHAAEQVLR